MQTRYKSLLALSLTFLAGCLLGVVIGNPIPRWFRTLHRAPGVDRAVAHMTEVLDLSPTQQKDVRKIFIQFYPEFIQETKRARAFHRAFLIKHFEEMAPLLSEKQKAAARRFLDEQLEKKLPPPPEEPGQLDEKAKDSQAEER